MGADFRAYVRSDGSINVPRASGSSWARRETGRPMLAWGHLLKSRWKTDFTVYADRLL